MSRAHEQERDHDFSSRAVVHRTKCIGHRLISTHTGHPLRTGSYARLAHDGLSVRAELPLPIFDAALVKTAHGGFLLQGYEIQVEEGVTGEVAQDCRRLRRSPAQTDRPACCCLARKEWLLRRSDGLGCRRFRAACWRPWTRLTRPEHYSDDATETQRGKHFSHLSFARPAVGPLQRRLSAKQIVRFVEPLQGLVAPAKGLGGQL